MYFFSLKLLYLLVCGTSVSFWHLFYFSAFLDISSHFSFPGLIPCNILSITILFCLFLVSTYSSYENILCKHDSDSTNTLTHLHSFWFTRSVSLSLFHSQYFQTIYLFWTLVVFYLSVSGKALLGYPAGTKVWYMPNSS